ncbi:hypothetical protein RND81_05G017800 [Saponaria officinalis]|uniref:Ubiquitin-like protease family profile domain-containing protein n=1 Tax=Saponaria officinalis TaxID=3572 RepID=A0AAW1KPW2_SAPOF
MQLGYWLLSNYEPAKNCLILPGGKELHFRAVDVHATLGFPMGSKEVQLAKSLNESDDYSRFYNSWRHQFPPTSGLVSTKTLVHHLVNQEDGGDLFNINWVVLVVSLLIQNTQKPNANFHVLKSLMSVDEIPQYNWCEFVLKSLRTCQKSWVKANKKGYVTGPLLFLMDYVLDLSVTTKAVSNQLILLQSKLNCGSSILPTNQTIKKLRSVAQNLLNGTCDELNENHSPNNIEVSASVDVSPKVVPCLNMDDDDAFFNLPDVINAIDRAEKYFKAYIHDYAVSAKNMACNMVTLDEKVEEAPASMWDTDEVSDASLIASCDAAKKAYDRKRRYQAILEKFRNRSPAAGIGEFTFDLGVDLGVGASIKEGTPCVPEEGTNDVVTPEDNPHDGGDAVHDDNSDNDSEETISDPMITVDYDGNDDEPLSSSFPTSNPLGGDRVMTRKRSSTTPFVPELRSPFLIRNIDIKVPITKRKQMVCDYIFSTSPNLTAPQNEVVFQYKLITITRSILRSLRPREHISSGVLDGWAAYLNHRELGKSDSNSVTMKSSNKTEEQMNTSFKNALQAELNEFNWFQLKLIDMKEALAHFLMSHNETRSKGEVVDGMEPVVVKMSWRSTTNVDDCGVYVIRHMETFKGDPKWGCGLKKNDVGTLDKLRLSYCATLVFFKGNVVSKVIIDRA